MDVGICLPDNSARCLHSQELSYSMNIAGELCCKTDEASLSLDHLPLRVDRHDVLANMFRNNDAWMLTRTCACILISNE